MGKNAKGPFLHFFHLPDSGSISEFADQKVWAHSRMNSCLVHHYENGTGLLEFVCNRVVQLGMLRDARNSSKIKHSTSLK